MAVHSGRCGLCLRSGDLQESHLIPTSVHKQVRDLTGGAHPNPVVVSRRKSFLTSKEVCAPLLCRDCEQRFSSRGEQYVVGQCAQLNGQFKLREALQASSPLYDTPQFKMYDVQPLLGEKVERYLYFAASVFWRASARQWKIGTEPLDKISLGSMYQEQFRRYLLDQDPFPQNARVWVSVSNEHELHRMIVSPYTQRIDGVVRRHDFYIPGIRFILFLGKISPERLDAGALNGIIRPMMSLCPWKDDPVFLGSIRLTRRSIPSGKLRKYSR